MANLSDFAEALLLKWLMTDETATRPTTWFLALYSAAPNDAGGGTELSGNGYARTAVDFGTTGATNSADVVFPTATGSNWAQATHIGIFDASSGGNLLWHGAMTTPKTVAVGDNITFAAGEVDLALD